MGLGIGTVMVLAGIAFGIGLVAVEDRSGAFAWILVGCGVLVIGVALVINGLRHRPTGPPD